MHNKAETFGPTPFFPLHFLRGCNKTLMYCEEHQMYGLETFLGSSVDQHLN